METKKFDVTGMTCSACVAHVEKKCRWKLNGVEDVTVNLLTNSMSVNYDQNSLSALNIIESVQDAGYDAYLKAETSSDNDLKVNHAENEQLVRKKSCTVIYLSYTLALYIHGQHAPFSITCISCMAKKALSVLHLLNFCLLYLCI